MNEKTHARTPGKRKRILLGGLAVIVLAAAIVSFRLTRDGELKTPAGSGTTALDVGDFESFPLPDYAAAAVTDEYKSYLVEVEPGIKVHILEVGSGYPVLAMHGAPTSGFLYRHVAEELPLDQFRIIMPTMVGLGFSSKVPASHHTIENHLQWMTSAVGQLELDGLIYIGHDWGGPIGMGVLERSPGLIEGAVMLNTILTARTGEVPLPTQLKIIKTPVVGEVLLEGFSSAFDQMAANQADPDSMPPDVVDLYRRPVTESGNAKGPLAILRMASDDLDGPMVQQSRTTEAYVRTLDIPVEIVWGTNDAIVGKRLDDMVALFPDARVTETEAGHFLQEEGEGPETVAAATVRVFEEIEARRDSPQDG